MTRRLVVCCDGTWDRPDHIDRGIAAPTNVTKVALGVARQDAHGVDQLLYYQAGVGTRRFERIRGGAFGLGLSRNVRDCYAFLVENYKPGDELYFFGFSRGAFTARSAVGLVRNAGILRRAHADRVKDAYRLYRSRKDRAHPTGIEARIFRRMYSHEEIGIHFVGVWDTVGSLGIPIGGVRIPFANRLWGFHDTDLSSRVRFAYQALAIDEERGPFPPTLWKQQEHAIEQTLEQLWFSGVHCDVGGGYHDAALADIALLWLVARARQCGLAFEPDHFRSPGHAIDAERRALGEDTAPDALGAIHTSRKGIYRVLPRHRRSIIEQDDLVVASSTVRRHHEMSDYTPAGLEQYLAAGGLTVPVQDCAGATDAAPSAGALGSAGESPRGS